MVKIKKQHVGDIKINEKWCKGCGICVEFCAQKVLEMKNGRAVLVNIEQCTQCMLCELRCPDFAITVGGGINEK